MLLTDRRIVAAQERVGLGLDLGVGVHGFLSDGFALLEDLVGATRLRRSVLSFIFYVVIL